MTEVSHHDLSVRVYYEDTDAAGIVYYANYLRYAERARTEMMREIGFKSSDIMAEEGIALGVRHCSLDYKRPAKLDDELRVETRVGKVGGATIELSQVVWRGDEELVAMNVRLGCMTLDGRAARLPADVRRAFQQHIED